MRFYVEQKNGVVTEEEYERVHLSSPVEHKRGDSSSIPIQFMTAGVIGELATPLTLKFGCKVAGAYGGSYVVSNWNGSTYAYTASGSGTTKTYTVAPGWNTTKLNNLLGYDPDGFAEVTEIRCVADVAGSLDGKYFALYDNAGSVGIWIDVDNGGGSAPSGALACTRQIEITTITTGMTAAQVAAAIAAVLEADSKFSATASGGLVTVTDAFIGTRTDASAGDSGFGVTPWIHGSTPNTMTKVAYVDLDAEIEATANGAVISSRTFTIRAHHDINQGGEGAQTSGTPVFNLVFEPSLTGYTGGGATNLDGIATVALAAGLVIGFVHPTDGLRFYQLTAGTDAEASPTVIRPDDYNASTNAKVWKLVL